MRLVLLRCAGFNNVDLVAARRLAERLGADIEQVRRGIGSDPRIGAQFLYAGCGYGGSCFPKDVKALRASAAAVGEPLHVLAAVERANERQKHVLVDRVVARFGHALSGRTFALWGLAFKPNTDDMREAPSLVVVRELTARGARIVAHDPQAMDAARAALADVRAIVDEYDEAIFEGVYSTDWFDIKYISGYTFYDYKLTSDGDGTTIDSITYNAIASRSVAGPCALAGTQQLVGFLEPGQVGKIDDSGR